MQSAHASLSDHFNSQGTVDGMGPRTTTTIAGILDLVLGYVFDLSRSMNDGGWCCRSRSVVAREALEARAGMQNVN